MKKTIVSQCEINECFQKFLSFFSINFCQIHNVHTMKQSFMFNSALNSQWNPLFSIEISFFDPHSLKNLITRFACYYSLRSYPQLALLVIRFLSLWGSKNEISLSTKWIPLFVANTVKQKPILKTILPTFSNEEVIELYENLRVVLTKCLKMKIAFLKVANNW